MQPLPAPRSFLDAAEQLGVAFDAGDVERFGLYLSLLLDANTRFNLTSVVAPEAAWEKHVLDALTLLPLLAGAPPGASIVDVGSGGGSPGLPLAIALPSMRLTLLETREKKANFLRETVSALGLTNATVAQGRAEDLAASRPCGALREAFDVVVARALGKTPVALELTTPLVKPGGVVLLIKGAQAEAEVTQSRDALHLLHARALKILPTPTGRIIVIAKDRSTPAKYPRQAGEPSRRPLGAQSSS